MVLVYTLLHFPEIPPQPVGGWLGKLLGLTKAAPPLPAASMLPAPREADDEIDTGKAWHAIHFLLTGQARPANGLLGFLCSGGAVIAGADVGYGPPRAYTSDQVAALVATLSRLDREALYQRYQPMEMDKQRVYPRIWARDRDKGFEYIWGQFQRLRAFLGEAHARKQGLLVYYK